MQGKRANPRNLTRRPSGLVDNELRDKLLHMGNLQKKEAIKICSKDIISKTRDVDGLIANLFSSFCLNSSDKERLDIKSVSEDKLLLLIDIIQKDEKGDKAEKFLQALIASTNDTLCKLLVTEGLKTNQKWLEVQKAGRDLVQQHYCRLLENLRDVETVIEHLKSKMVILSCRGETVSEKIGDLLQQVNNGGITTVLCFVTHLQEGVNVPLFKLISRSEKMASITYKLQEVYHDMLSSVKQKFCATLKDIIPIPGNTFHMDIIIDRNILLKLNALIRFPSKPRPNQTNKPRNCKSVEEVYRMNDADKLFSNTKNHHRVTVVQGETGSGKTVLLQRWTVNWAVDLKDHANFNVYIPMSAVQSKDLLDIIFEDLMLIGKEFRAAFQYFMQDVHLQSCMTFLVDGVDENISGMEKSDIWNLISGSLLPKAKVVVTTRMYQGILEKFKPLANRVVTLTGVTERSRESFIHHMLGPKAGSDDVESFIKRCKEFLFDSRLLGVPIYLTLLCVLAQEHCNDKRLETLELPKTRLEMYNTFADVFEKRYVAISYTGCDTEKHVQHTVPLMKYLIGRMSFHNLAQEKYVFTLQDLQDNFLEEHLVQRIGYFTEVSKHRGSAGRTYTFCHKTFQEYFSGIFCAKIGFPKTAMHLMTLESRGIFNNKRILAGLENVCIRKEWKHVELNSQVEETKSLEDSFQQVVTAIQFASGISTEFAKSVFLYGICACHLQVSTDRYGQPAYDTHYETSLVFESQDPSLMEDYCTYLLNVKKYTVTGIKATIPDNYIIAMYKYISEAMSKSMKCRLLNQLYHIKAKLCWNEENESILTETKNRNTDDALLSFLLDNELPSIICVSGPDVDFELVTNALRQTDIVKHLEIENADLSVLAKELWEELFTILVSKSMLEVLKLPFCNLQSYQMENIFQYLITNKAVKSIDISGNSLRNVTEKSLQLIGPVIDRHCTKAYICHCFIQEHDWITTTSNVCVVHNDVYIASFARFLKFNAILNTLSIDQSYLNDFHTESQWKNATEKLGTCKDLETLKITACRLTQEYHLQSLCTAFHKFQSLANLDLSQNNFGNIDDHIWTEFVESLSSVHTLRHLKLSKCRLMQNNHIRQLGKAFENLKHLVNLDLSRNSFGNCQDGEVIAFLNALQHLKHLETLDFSRCELRQPSLMLHLGDAVSTMVYLTDFNLSRNNFNKVGSRSWFNFLRFSKSTQHLAVVNFSGCGMTQSHHIEGLSQVIVSCPKLKAVDISTNNLSEVDKKSWNAFCTALRDKSTIEDINIMNCCITSFYQISKLAATIESSRNLKHFNIERNNMQHMVLSDWHSLVLALSKTSLQTLNMSRCGLQSSHFEGNATSLNKLQHLIHLDMHQNALGRIAQYDWTTFVSGLKTCYKLQHLNLSRNSLCEEHIASLGESLCSLTDSLLHLNLSENNIGESDNMAWNALMRGVENCKQLKELSLPRCKVHSNYQIERLGTVVRKLIHLEHLDISENDIHVDEPAWCSFAENLKMCRSLRKLNLDNCKLCLPFHFLSLGSLLACLTQLRHLNLSGNNMGEIRHWHSVLQGLQWCKKLQFVKFSNCRINTDSHVDTVIPVIRSLPRVTELNLSKNSLLLGSIENLMNVFSKCNQLRVIDLRECNTKLDKASLKWHVGDDGMTVQVYTKSVLDKIGALL